MFRANFQRTGVYQTTGVRQLRGLKWKYQKSPVFPGWEFSLAARGEIVCVGNTNGKLYRLDPQTGQQFWACQVGEKFFSPAIADGVVYVSSFHLGSTTKDEYLSAIDVQTGQQKWNLKLQSQPFSGFISSSFLPSSPTVANGVVYIGGGNGNLYAIDAISGELLWSFKMTKNMLLTSPAVDKEIICVGSSDGYLYAIDLTTRQQRWKFEIGTLPLFFPSIPAIANEKVYMVSSDNTLYTLNLQTGELLWTFQNQNLSLHPPAITDQFVCIGSTQNPFYVLDVETGQSLWTLKTGNIHHCSNPIIVDNTVYIGSQGFLQALDLETGEELWRFQPPNSEQWLLNPQTLFYELGNQLLKTFTGSTFNFEKFSAPVVAEGVVYVGCSNGYLYALH